MLKELNTILLLILCFSHVLIAQDAESTPALDSQFSSMITESETYNEFKVIKSTNLYRMKRSVKDSMNALKATLGESLTKENQQKDEIDRLNSLLNNTKTDLEEITTSKDSITFLGANFTKGTFKTIVWSIIGGLLALLLYFIYSYTRSKSLTVETKSKLDKIKSDFEAYKKRTLNKEQQIMRRLQDEINKK